MVNSQINELCKNKYLRKIFLFFGFHITAVILILIHQKFLKYG